MKKRGKAEEPRAEDLARVIYEAAEAISRKEAEVSARRGSVLGEMDPAADEWRPGMREDLARVDQEISAAKKEIQRLEERIDSLSRERQKKVGEIEMVEKEIAGLEEELVNDWKEFRLLVPAPPPPGP